MISVVIPAYNVDEYIDKCLKSVVNQTYRNIEIILINDGSTDKTAEKCFEWTKKDDRIIFINKKNEGQGSARNLGINIASREYIIFVDSDDWLELNMIEDIYNYMIENDSDICLFDYYEVYKCENEKLEKKYIHISDSIDNAVNVFERKDLISSMITILCNKMFKRSLFTQYNIKMTNNVCEDLSILPLIFTKAKLICHLKKALYNYNLIRQGNVSTDFIRIAEVKDSLEILKDNFVKNNLFDEFYNELFELSFATVKIFVRRAVTNLSEDEATKIKKVFLDFLNQNYIIFKNNNRLTISNVYVWGSYNTRVMVHKLLIYNENLKKHFSASSIISAMSKKSNKLNNININNENKFRKKMINYDINKTLDNLTMFELEKIDYIFIDFLEEINDIIDLNDSYITKSTFFDESEIELDGSYKILKITDSYRTELWKKYCNNFITFLNNNFKNKKVILVKNKLSEKYGSYGKVENFNNEVYLKKINNILDEYYEFFEKNINDVVIVSLDNDNYKFTDINFEYGCYPYYLNNIYYNLLGRQIRLKL